MAKKKNRSQQVSEAIERWQEMETSELLLEQQALKDKEDFHMEEISLIKALKKALKEILADRDVSNCYGDDNPDDGLRTIHHF